MLPIKLIQQKCTSKTILYTTNQILFRSLPKTSVLKRCFILENRKFLATSNLLYGAGIKKTNLSVKSVKSAEVFQEAIEKKKKEFQEKKQKFQDNIRGKKSKVEEVILRENILTIPNFLCLSRIVMSPYLGYTIVHGDFTIAMGLMIVAAFTDLADGYIARNWEGQKSNFGSFLDPLADKTLVTTLVITLTFSNLMPLWLTSMIVFRDLFLIAAAFVIRYRSLPKDQRTLTKYFDATNVTAQLAPTFISKVNTVVQLFTIGASLGAPIFNYVDHSMLYNLWYLTGVTTFAAALSYVTQRKNTYKYLIKTKKN